MLDINKVKIQIVEKLKFLNPKKIILFGSYAYGTPTQESDIDLFLLKDTLSLGELDSYELKARKSIRELIYKYKVGFDILSAPTNYITEKEDYFYKIDILENGKVWYEQ
ncbi:MAG: nucleotidyltransferase domain-containing protein [Campylobacterota bacterium]|nr:nucleotidyltransferase domain-containing protein [Campylobacterota bacterium]